MRLTFCLLLIASVAGVMAGCHDHNENILVDAAAPAGGKTGSAGGATATGGGGGTAQAAGGVGGTSPGAGGAAGSLGAGGAG